MRTKIMRGILCLFISPLLLIPLSLYGQDTSLTVTFAGSAGYILESPNKKVVIDAIYGDIVKNFDAGFPSNAILDSLSQSAHPYDSIDLFIASHEHAGHFDAQRMVACFEKNPDAILVATQEAKDAMASIAANWAEMEPRIYVPDIEPYETKDTSFQDISMSITRIPHTTPSGVNNFYLNIEGMTVAYYIGYIPEYDEYYGQTEDIDVGLIQGDWITSAQEVTDSIYDIQFISLTHLNTFRTVRANLLNYIEEQNLDDVNFMYMAMEEMLFTKTNGIVHADTLNLGPEINIALPDADTIAPGEELNYTIPETSFFDQDGDDLKYSFALSNGDPLYDWISVDMETLNFSGSPAEEKNVRIIVSVTDKNGAFLKDDFIIFVDDGISSLEANQYNDLLLYPNPAHSILTVQFDESLPQFTELSLYTLKGELIWKESVEGKSEISLDVSSLNKGEYLLTIIGEKKIYSKRFIRL